MWRKHFNRKQTHSNRQNSFLNRNPTDKSSSLLDNYCFHQKHNNFFHFSTFCGNGRVSVKKCNRKDSYFSTFCCRLSVRAPFLFPRTLLLGWERRRIRCRLTFQTIDGICWIGVLLSSIFSDCLLRNPVRYSVSRGKGSPNEFREVVFVTDK